MSEPPSEDLGEFEIIARYFAPLATDPAGHGLQDDAACLAIKGDQSLIVTTDTLVEGVHFLPGDPPDSIGYKALAVNLSDLAAKGASARAYLLNLSLPVKDGRLQRAAPWLDSLARGLRALQESAGIALVGGDTTAIPGPLTLSVTALGECPQGKPVLRRGAEDGDWLYVTGSIGDAVLGLELLTEPGRAKRWGLSLAGIDRLVRRYQRPEPRFPLSPALRNSAKAAIDISDGFIADLGKLCRESNVGIVIETGDIPFSEPAAKALAAEPELLTRLLTGGDDYEILAAIAPDRADAFEEAAAKRGIPVKLLGRFAGQAGLTVMDPTGTPLHFSTAGYVHFRPHDDA